MYADSGKPSTLDVWKWSGTDIAKYCEISFENSRHPALLQHERYVCTGGSGAESASIRLASLSGDATAKEWPTSQGWWCTNTQSSRAGNHVAVCLREKAGEWGPSDRDREKPRALVGLINRNTLELAWVGTLVGTYGGSDGNIRTALPSDDGTFVAVAAWDHGVAMLDTSKKEMLWSTCPSAGGPTYYTAFSPDSRIIYAGGTEGCVYGMDVRSGAILSRWCATRSGKPEYGHRISCLGVSPDGRWVAAGTGPEGLIWLWRVTDGKCMKILDHGGSTVQLVHFSPDSSALASFVPGTLKVWKVSRWDGDSGNGGPPGERPATSPTTTAPTSSEP